MAHPELCTMVGPWVQHALHEVCCCPIRGDTRHHPQLAKWKEGLDILLSLAKLIFNPLASI